MSHLALLLRALETGNPDYIRVSLQDRLHQPYRQSLIAGYQSVYLAALVAGAYGLVISGAGPTLLALTCPHLATDVTEAIMQAWEKEGIKATVVSLSLDREGAKVV